MFDKHEHKQFVLTQTTNITVSLAHCPGRRLHTKEEMPATAQRGMCAKKGGWLRFSYINHRRLDPSMKTEDES